jgi:hypothetical protein
MTNFSQRKSINSYVENQIAEERVHMFYAAMSYGQRLELYDPSFTRHGDVSAPMYNAALAVPNGTHLGLHQYGRSSDATPMERFRIISSADEPFPLHAKMGMEKLDIGQGDMLQAHKRCANIGWTERNMTRGEEENPTSSMQAMKVTTLKEDTKDRARATKMRRARRGKH